jgi:hypothetical protein
MKYVRHAAALILVIGAWAPSLAVAQDVAAPARVELSREEMETFLLKAKIVRTRGIDTGITNTRRATLSDGVITHDAQIQTIDQTLSKFEAPGALPEFNFVDSYRYNIAAYRLALLLGLDNVPMSVERSVGDKRAAVTWWIDDVMIDEGTRQKKQVRSPDNQRTSMQIHIMRVFDELISNRDRNAGNLLWTSDWKMWMIDHTRCFRLSETLLKPALLERIDRSLMNNLRALTRESVTQAVGSSLTRYEIGAMLARRDAIVKLFEMKIAERGEAAILYTLPR